MMFQLYYDAASRPAFVDYNGMMYAYVHNLQGDITGILDSAGTMVVTYSYDAWGKPVQTNGSMANTLGKINPFRYRGYVFDEETGFYYLESRYYVPLVGRFINADAYVFSGYKILGMNMYYYCGNNPIVLVDSKGERPVFGIDPNRETKEERRAVFEEMRVLLYGAASAFKQLNVDHRNVEEAENQANCYAYVLRYYGYESISPGFNSNPYQERNIDAVADAVEADLAGLGRGCRRLSFYNSPIRANEYRIALRIHEVDSKGRFEYHFIVQIESGNWADKPGPKGDTRLSGRNPEAFAWDYDGVEGFYNSDRIVYFAITPP